LKNLGAINLLAVKLTYIYLFNDDERQAGAWMYSSSRHVERTNSRRTVTRDCKQTTNN